MISGSFGLNFYRRMPTVRVSVHLRRFTSDFVSIDFLVDTGATDTYLHPQDAMVKVGIDPALLSDPAQWSHRKPTSGVGGDVTCYIEPAVYLFHHDNGRQARRITHEIHIVPLTPTNDKLPSILGMDILSQFIPFSRSPAV